MAKKKIDFFIESLKTLKQSGTFTQSSPALCKAMTSHITSSDKIIIELGAGDGAVTKHILKNMAPDAKLISFEINDVHYKVLLEINDDRFYPVLDSAEHLEDHLTDHKIDCIDTIISSIPFVVLPTELSIKILDLCHQYLQDKKLFVQYHYSLAMKNLYQRMFNNVDTEFVLLNAPPAVVFRCER